MRTRNPNANCGNCPYSSNDDNHDKYTMCRLAPEEKVKPLTSWCRRHPDFFLPPDISDSTEFTCLCGYKYVMARRLTPEEQVVLDAAVEYFEDECVVWQSDSAIDIRRKIDALRASRKATP